jgi:N-acetylneuraminate synthase
MKLEEANLKCITTLKKEFDCDIGYSGHEVSSYVVCLAAVMLGATSIERHVTLDRSMYGSDQSASLEKPGLERLVRDIHRTDLILGDGIKRIWDSEKPEINKILLCNSIFIMI